MNGLQFLKEMLSKTVLLFLNMSGGEIFIILLFVLLFFGAESIPKISRNLGKVLYQIRNATDDIKRDIRNSAENVRKDVMDQGNDSINPITDIKKDIDDSLKDLNP